MYFVMKLTDKQLYCLCEKYGRLARLWRQKFAGLLPEVYKRRLFEKKGYGSIFEFAAKLAGMSQDQVRMVLNLERRFEDKPILKNMLENGEVSVNKLARVASVVSQENEEFWAGQAKLLPSRALETLIKDEKFAKQLDVDNAPAGLNNFSAPPGASQNGLPKPRNDPKSLHVQTANTNSSLPVIELQLSFEVQQKLIKLQRKGIDINSLLLEFLEKRELEIAQEKERLAEDSEAAARNRILTQNKKPSRHIPQSIKNLLKQEFGEKCAVPTCMKSSETIHHTRRFALSGNHNPYFLAPLCEEHHAIAHSIDMNIHNHRTPP